MNPLIIGSDRGTGRRILLRPAEILAHAIVAGGTGRGKSQLAILLCRYSIENRLPALFLDPHGDSYRDMVAYVTARRLKHIAITIDANEAADSSVFPLNFLAPNGLDSATHASLIMKALAKVFREQDAETKPRLERRERATLIALIEAGYTLAEMMDFLAIKNQAFRQRVLSRVTNPYVLQEWSEFDSMAKRSDKETLLESVLNRAAKVILNDPVRRVLGAATCNLDWEEIRRKRLAVLVNLQPVRVSRECQQLIGTMILDHLCNYAMQATKSENSMLVLADEMDELASPDFASMFQALRKRGVFCWSSFQYLEQLRSRDDTNRLLAAAMACCDIKIAFHTSYEDAALMARELFPGSFRGDVVKDELYRTTLLPKESRRTVDGSSVSESEVSTESDSEGSSEGIGMGFASVYGVSDGQGQAISSGSGEPLVFSENSGESSVSASSESMISSYSRSHATSYSHARSRSRSKTIVPFYEYDKTKELGSRSFYTAEEELEKRIALIQLQAPREAILKVGDKPPVLMQTAFVAPVRVRPKDFYRTLAEISRKHALPVAEVDRLIESRRLIESPADVPVVEEENSQSLEELFRPERKRL